MKNQELKTQSNYELLRSIANNPYRQLDICEKSTGKTGVASLTKEGVYVFYGADDSSDDKEITIEEFNTLFETEICKLSCPLW